MPAKKSAPSGPHAPGAAAAAKDAPAPAAAPVDATVAPVFVVTTPGAQFREPACPRQAGFGGRPVLLLTSGHRVDARDADVNGVAVWDHKANDWTPGWGADAIELA